MAQLGKKQGYLVLIRKKSKTKHTGQSWTTSAHVQRRAGEVWDLNYYRLQKDNFFIATTSIDVHIVAYTYSKIKSQKSHTRYLISSQGILHFTKQLKNVDMFRVCN